MTYFWIGYLVLGWLIAFRIIFRKFYSCNQMFGFDGFDLVVGLFVATCVSTVLMGVALPLTPIFIGVRWIVASHSLDPEMVARLIAGESRQQKLNRKQQELAREVIRRQREIRELERSCGIKPLEAH